MRPAAAYAGRLWLVLIALLAFLPALAFAQPGGWEPGTDGLAKIPALSARVTDLTGTLGPAEKQALEAKLAAFEQQSGGQFAVLMVPSTQPEPIEAYSIRVADAWKIGRKGQDNGVLLVVAKDDRKVRLEVGYGYEGALTDATSRRIIAETISPFFRQGQFAAGIGAGVDRVSSVIAKGEPAPPTPQGRPVPQRGIDPAMIFLLLFIVVPVLGGILRRLFGKVGGATVGAGIVGAVAWGISGVLLIAIAAAVISWFVMLLFSMGGGGTVIRNGSVVRRGPYIGGGFPGGWGGGGGGGWGGGGGGFGGGGASGDW